ncbi:MAG: helix-turn-helix transcriptional regulator [bacterium]|nr:helix-turn-helix transcriptional regulator [bacterium]
MLVRKEKQFQIITAGIGLSKYIQYYNICFPDKDSFTASYTMMPNACGTVSIAFDGISVKTELWGASLNTYTLGVEPNGYQVLVLIKLTHVGLFQLTRQNQANLIDQRMNLEDIDAKLYRELTDAFVFSESVDDMVNRFEKILYRRMEQDFVSETIIHATSLINRNHGMMRVREVANETGYCERQLNRLFQNQVGMSTKQYLGLTRFNYLLQNIQLSPLLFSALSQEVGYFDQSHMDKDFKKISGISPLEYRSNMSDFYYDGSEKADMLLYKTNGGKNNGN